jgi:penicillin-binding protein 2
MSELRIQLLWLGIVFLIILLLGGLWRIQVKQGSHFFLISEDNRIKHIPLEAQRGTIYDRHKKVLVDSRPAFNVLFVAHELKKNPKTINRLAKIMNVDPQNIWNKIRKNRNPAFLPSKLFQDITRKQLAQIEERTFALPGIFVNVQPKRRYLNGQAAAHVLGYVGELNRKELNQMKSYGYVLGDSSGKDGVERVYEHYLKGEKGGQQIEVTASGRPHKELGYKEPRKGHDLLLTIDLDVQKLVDQAMSKHKGAVVVMHPQNGEILAMGSYPSFDPNLFSEPSRYKELKDLLNNRKSNPLMNRAIRSTYSPGSIFKIFIALLGLEDKEITAMDLVTCTGSYRIGRLFHCWYETGHGPLSVRGALRTSCNVFFYRLGVKLGVKRISTFIKLLGFGQRTGVDLLGEQSGFVPTPSWKKERFKESWYPGETVNLSIGQGYLLVTPLQLLNCVNVIVNGGTLHQPHLLKTIFNRGEEALEPIMSKTKKFLFNKENLNLVRGGMKDVVNDPRGSGQRAFLDNVVVAGKTGTVQVVGRKTIELINGEIPEKYRNHAWFAGYAPFEDPQVSIIVFLEHGQSGGRYAAVVAHEILKGIFDLPQYI